MLIEERELLPQEMLHQLVLSMRRRCEATIAEDIGKRNMPGKRARRHFSQLGEFERGLNIGMKTAGWSTRRVAGQVDRSECAVRNCWEQWTREAVDTRGKPGLERPGKPQGERIERSCGKHLWTPQ
ncbi:uncharacterized protein TNCV_3291641 [Trichonephila clavipes]|nr:uncharacterized protein TNCV_3291641 [Trichonephila clavipes]